MTPRRDGARRVSQSAEATDHGFINQVAGDQVAGNQYVYQYSARIPLSGNRDVRSLKAELRKSVRAQESVGRAHLLGLDIVRPTAAAPRYAVEHITRFRGLAAAEVHTDVLGFFRDVAGQRLVILGPSGAGKSVLAVELILRLLHVAKPDDPVPVRFDLAGWDPAQDLTYWIIAQLTSRHGVPAARGHTLLYEREILPVFDGLDEISAERDDLAAAVRALNVFLAERSDTGFVVTCRNNVYADIGRRIEPSSEITILPLTADEVIGFIEGSSVGDRVALQAWQPVLAAVRSGSPPVLQALSTPWRLTLAVTFFLDRGNTNELIPADGEDDAEYTHRVRDLLVGTFAPARARLYAIGARAEADAWCTLIAEELDQQVSRGAPRQDIIIHYAADRAWGAELTNRATFTGFGVLGISLLLGVFALVAWLVDTVEGTSLVVGLRTVMEAVARSPVSLIITGPLAATLLAFIVTGVPRASRETRDLLRHPGLTRRQEVRARFYAVLTGAGNFLLVGLTGLVMFGVFEFLVLWPIIGAAGTALRTTLLIGSVQALTSGCAAYLGNVAKYTYEVWYGCFMTDRRHEPDDTAGQSLYSTWQRGASANWTTPSESVDKVVGTPRIRRNWPAAVENLLVAGYKAGIFRRSAEVYQFRHRQLQDWYARPVNSLRAWDNELPLPHELDDDADDRWGQAVRQLNGVSIREGRAAAQRMILRQEQDQRNAELRDFVGGLGDTLRPAGILPHCDIAVLDALRAAEDEARATGSALIEPWHLFITLFDHLTRVHTDCPIDADQIRAAFRPIRTISVDESPGHLPLARSLRADLGHALVKRRRRLRPEFVAQQILDANGDPAHRIVLALRHPVDAEPAVRAWLQRRIAELEAARPAEDVAALVRLADVVQNVIGRPDEAERILQEADALGRAARRKPT